LTITKVWAKERNESADDYHESATWRVVRAAKNYIKSTLVLFGILLKIFGKSGICSRGVLKKELLLLKAGELW
jgi:hypothetical protein